MSEEEKKIEIVSGSVNDLEISPVYEHLNVAKPKSATDNNKSNIVVPKVKKKEDKKEDSEDSDEKEEDEEDKE